MLSLLEPSVQRGMSRFRDILIRSSLAIFPCLSRRISTISIKAARAAASSSRPPDWPDWAKARQTGLMNGFGFATGSMAATLTQDADQRQWELGFPLIGTILHTGRTG